MIDKEELKIEIEKIPEKDEFGERDPKAIYKILFVIGILAIILSFFLIAGEFLEVIGACEDLNGKYSFKIYPTQHLCNNQNFSEYNIGGWNFDSNRDFNVDFDPIDN